MNTTVEEFKAFLGIYIYVGVHLENEVSSYWKNNSKLQHQ